MRQTLLVSATLLVLSRFAAGAGPALNFEDATAAAGLEGPLRGIMAHAAACGDIDGDGDLDLYIGNFCDRPAGEYLGASGPVPNILLVQDGGRFRDVGQKAVSFQARTSGAVFADLDNDGDLDLYVSNNSKNRGLRSPNRLYENTGGGAFRDVSAGNGACILMGGRSVGVLDFDGDGLLDLLVAWDSWTGDRTRLFRNLGKLAFEDATTQAGLPEDLPGLGIATPDLNDDGWPDIIVAQANRIFLSGAGGKYRECVAASKSIQYPRLGNEDSPCGVAFGDVDRDGRQDLVIVDHNQPARQHLFLNQGLRDGAVTFRDATKAAGLEYLFPRAGATGIPIKHAHVEIADFDNDGWPDILIAATWRDGDREQPFICRNLGVRDGQVRFQVPPLEKAIAYFPAGPTGDYDRDGRPDVMLASWFPRVPSRLFLNRTRGGHWLTVRVRGRTVNRMGIGSKVRLYAAGKLGRPAALLGSQEVHISHGFCTGQEAAVHFGLGETTGCDVEVTLPFGKGAIRREGVRADQVLTIEEP